jgi:hypothetical protein
MQKYYIFLNLGPTAGPAQANIIVLQLPIIETRAEVLLGARADAAKRNTSCVNIPLRSIRFFVATQRCSLPSCFVKSWSGETNSIMMFQRCKSVFKANNR